MEEGIRFKVVTRNGRWSTNTVITAKRGRYALQYPKGEIVKAWPDTLGIMVFDGYKHAVSFRGTRSRLKIIKVRPIGKGHTPRYVAYACSDNGIDRFYGKKTSVHPSLARAFPPAGTECYGEVEVLE